MATTASQTNFLPPVQVYKPYSLYIWHKSSNNMCSNTRKIYQMLKTVCSEESSSPVSNLVCLGAEIVSKCIGNLSKIGHVHTKKQGLLSNFKKEVVVQKLLILRPLGNLLHQPYSQPGQYFLSRTKSTSQVRCTSL